MILSSNDTKILQILGTTYDCLHNALASTICSAGFQDVDIGGVVLEVGHFNNRTLSCGCEDYRRPKVSATDWRD